MMRLFGPPNIDKLESKGDVNGLVKALRHKDLFVGSRAARALDGLGWDPSDTEEAVLHAVAKPDFDACIEIGEPAVKPIIERMQIAFRRPEWRSWLTGGARALGEIGNPRAVDILIEALSVPFPTRAAAADALGKINDPRAVEPLVEALALSNYQESAAALDLKAIVLALGRIGDQRAVEPLIAALDTLGFPVREIVAQALGMLGDPRAIEPLIAALSHPREDKRSLELASWGMGATTPLRRAAAKALKEITGKDFGDDADRWRQWRQRMYG